MLGLASHQLGPRAVSGMAKLQSWPSIAAFRPAQAPSQARQAIHASACFLSICLAFLVYGVLQERVMTVGFGKERELFTSSLFVVFCNRLMTCCISVLVALIQSGGVQPKAPLQSYAAVSFANLVASTCQYDSLKYVSFAMQTLAKCCKVLPVMVWGVLLRKKRYPATEVLTAACVVAGCAAFIFSGSVLSKVVSDSVTWQLYAIGCGLLLLYLAFDGFASTWQDRLFAGFEMDTSNQVLYTSLFSTMISLCVLLSTGEVWSVAQFLMRHPPAAIYITAVSSVATIIQYFVAYTIKTYGALNFATIMTARQFLSVIASCVIFRHSFTPGQWCVPCRSAALAACSPLPTKLPCAHAGTITTIVAFCLPLMTSMQHARGGVSHYQAL